ncbi:MAG: divalent-cation tolerance protein CutA [Candidatus Methanomethylicia archaeon]
MVDNDEYIVVLITTPSISEAEKIVNALLEEKLIACANIIENVKSKFLWMGKMEEAQEALIVIKTKKELIEKLYTRVKSLHSYTVPEIIAIPIIAGYKPYLQWISEVVICKN